MPFGTVDHVSRFYGPMAIYRFLRGPAYSPCEPTIMLGPISVPKPTTYAHEVYGENSIANFGGSVEQRYTQQYGTGEPIFHTPMPEHLPQPNIPPESHIKEYSEQVDRIFIDVALDDLFGNKVMDNRLESIDSIDNWVEPVADNTSLESAIVGGVDGISNDSTAIGMPETELSNDPSLDDMLGSSLDTPAVEQLTGHEPEGQVDASSLEGILGEKMGDPMADDMPDVEPAEEPEQMPPYMPPEPFVGW